MSSNKEQMVAEWFVRYRRSFYEDRDKPWAAEVRAKAEAALRQIGIIVSFDPSVIEQSAVQQERAGV